MRNVDRDDLRKVPYIDHIPDDDRAVFLQPFLDKVDNKWKIFVPERNKLTWLFAEPVDSCYYAEEIIDNSKDIYLKIIDVVGRHYSYESAINTLSRIIRDLENCSVVVEKYFLFFNIYRKSKDLLISNLIATDLEYFFGNVRSMYDLLQRLLQDLWKRNKDRNLPRNFSKMMINSKDLERKYDLPEPLVKYYVDTKDFFVKCREIRNSIYHRGFDIQIVFCTEEGFAMQKDNPLFPNPLTSVFDIWPKAKIKENGLVSILALISHINRELLKNTDEFTQALVHSIKPPLPISETHKLFLRGPYIHHLLKSKEYLEKQWVEITE